MNRTWTITTTEDGRRRAECDAGRYLLIAVDGRHGPTWYVKGKASGALRVSGSASTLEAAMQEAEQARVDMRVGVR